MPVTAPWACPIDKTRLVQVTDTNNEGDTVTRWECPNGDWQGPWYVGEGTDEIHQIPELSRHVQLTQMTTTDALARESTQADLAKEATLQTVRDTLYRRTDPLPTGSNVVGYVSNTVVRKIAVEGKGQVIGGEVTTDVTFPDGYLSIENPAASGVNIIIFGVTLYTDAASAQVRYIHDFTDDPNTVSTDPIYFNHAGWGTPYQAVMKFGKEAITGGTTLSPRSQLTNQVPFALRDLPIIVTPGHSFAVKVTGLASGSLIMGNVYWYEDPV